MNQGTGRRVRLLVNGVVQGVGFRPFVYRTATRLGLAGLVRNTTAGVEIEVEGEQGQIDEMIRALRHDAPPIAVVERIEVEDQHPCGESSFRVEESRSQTAAAALISPDVSTCPQCEGEFRNSSDRRHGYPFTNCTNCGPRFTIVESVPYDRPRTTMRRFELCPACRTEYENPLDRRYHAEPNACPLCGPKLTLFSASGKMLAEGGDALVAARQQLASGKIVAVKGLGGFHLACDAASEAAVSTLRRRKGRPFKPLAVMCRDLATARAYCEVSPQEERELCGNRRPIILLQQRPSPPDGLPPIADPVAPGLRELGVMLPYTPLHHLLFEGDAPRCLVLTSGNRSEEPIIAENDTAVDELGRIADVLLVHDRAIANRCDDSVVHVHDGRLTVLRRSRGFVPLPLTLETTISPTIALGALTSNAFLLGSGHRAFLSQHIGDVDSLESLVFLREAIEKYCRWMELEPRVVAHDMHPDLLTTRLAMEMSEGRARVAVQHHHAHLVSAAAAAGLCDTEVQGLVLDGTGWGPDGTIWGGELLVGSAAGFRRAGHLRQLPLPGGDAAIRRPARTAVAWLHALAPATAGQPLDLWQRVGEEEAAVVRRMVDRRFNTLPTSSAGRFFDAVSSILGVCDDVTYEGQAAIELEHLARAGDPDAGGKLLRIGLGETDGTCIWDPETLFTTLTGALAAGVPRADLALDFHHALAGALAGACRRVREDGGPETVVLCGGVFQNRILTGLAGRALEEAGLRPVYPGAVPVNDGGLALGQALVAAANERH